MRDEKGWQNGLGINQGFRLWWNVENHFLIVDARWDVLKAGKRTCKSWDMGGGGRHVRWAVLHLNVSLCETKCHPEENPWNISIHNKVPSSLPSARVSSGTIEYRNCNDPTCKIIIIIHTKRVKLSHGRTNERTRIYRLLSTRNSRYFYDFPELFKVINNKTCTWRANPVMDVLQFADKSPSPKPVTHHATIHQT